MIKKDFEFDFQVKEQANVVKVKAQRLNCNLLAAISILHDSTFKGKDYSAVPGRFGQNKFRNLFKKYLQCITCTVVLCLSRSLSLLCKMVAELITYKRWMKLSFCIYTLLRPAC